MTTARTCPRCGATLPPSQRHAELCPACLLKAGLDTEVPPAGAEGAGADDDVGPERLAELLPDLEILEELGHGGMGVVYKARQKRLERTVALKVLPASFAHDPSFTARFLREARALARLAHPNIVGVHDVGEVEGVHYILMEYAAGVNLRQLVAERRLAPREALALVPQICDALQYAHDRGIVHRDIKPENILVEPGGGVKIADFGLAKLVERNPEDVTLTAAQQVLGTFQYMAPEQIDRPTEVDHRADIYSLGVVLYELLTGEVPRGHFPPPSQRVQVDVRLDDVILKALARAPEERQQQASEVKTGISAATATTSTDAAGTAAEATSATSAPAPSEKSDEGVPWRYVAGATLLFALGWVQLGAAWNFGLAGLIAGAIVLLAVFAVNAYWCARYKPPLAAAMRSGRRFSAWSGALFSTAIAVLGLSSCTYQLGTLDRAWDHSYERFEEHYRGAEHRLVRGLEAFEEEMPRMEISRAASGKTYFEYAAGDTAGILAMLVIGWVGVLGALSCLLETRELRHTWSYHWKPGLLLWALAFVGFGLVHFAAHFPIQRGDDGDIELGSRSFHGVPSKELRGAATLEAIEQTIDAWCEENGYVSDRHSFKYVLRAVPGFDERARGAVWIFEKPSPFDQVRVGWQGVHRRTPRIKVRAITSLAPRETRVRVDAGSAPRGFHASRDEALSELEPIARSLEATLERTLQGGE